MIEWYKKVVFENYANFNGRARRSEYWYFRLFTVLILLSAITIGSIIGSLFDNVFAGLGFAYILFALYSLLMILPSIAVLVRRLHDVDKSGWFFLVSLIPLVGAIWLLIVLCTEGTSGDNQYGSDPKESFNTIEEIGTVDLQ